MGIDVLGGKGSYQYSPVKSSFPNNIGPLEVYNTLIGPEHKMSSPTPCSRQCLSFLCDPGVYNSSPVLTPLILWARWGCLRPSVHFTCEAMLKAYVPEPGADALGMLSTRAWTGEDQHVMLVFKTSGHADDEGMTKIKSTGSGKGDGDVVIFKCLVSSQRFSNRHETHPSS